MYHRPVLWARQPPQRLQEVPLVPPTSQNTNLTWLLTPKTKVFSHVLFVMTWKNHKQLSESLKMIPVGTNLTLSYRTHQHPLPLHLPLSPHLMWNVNTTGALSYKHCLNTKAEDEAHLAKNDGHKKECQAINNALTNKAQTPALLQLGQAANKTSHPVSAMSPSSQPKN